MSTKLSVDLHKLAKFVNAALPMLTAIFFFAGVYFSFYFHFLTVAFLFLTLLNLFYLFGQKGHSILRNFGILGQGRYMLESVGPELRQYLFASNTEERPFNRNERSEVYRKAKGIDSTISFGSQMNFDAGEIKLRHSMFPISRDSLEPYRLVFGEERGLPAAYAIKHPIIISGMSYGALGTHAIRALARGAKMAGIPMNTGEGGYPKHHLMENCDLIFQLGTAKFGARHEDGSLDESKLREIAELPQVKMIEIKFSQGAKPGKGGILPKEKITDEIAELRGVPKDRDVISPPAHRECDSVPGTVRFIAKIQDLVEIPVGIKLALGRPDDLEALIAEMKEQDRFPDYIAVDGSEGGTGAAPKAFIDSVGIPLFPALTLTHDTLERHGVRRRLKLLASGKLVGPSRQAIAFCLGADAVCSARGFMLAIGCIQAMQCGNNTCPVGITTHDRQLQHGLVIAKKAPRVQNYVEHLEHDLDELLSSMGCRSVRELNFSHLFIPNDSNLHPILQHG